MRGIMRRPTEEGEAAAAAAATAAMAVVVGAATVSSAEGEEAARILGEGDWGVAEHTQLPPELRLRPSPRRWEGAGGAAAALALTSS